MSETIRQLEVTIGKFVDMLAKGDVTKLEANVGDWHITAYTLSNATQIRIDLKLKELLF